MSAFLEPLQSCKIVSSLVGLPADATLIGTHDGSFHCDEVLAISMLSILPNYKPSATTYIVRSRNPDILEKCHIVVDVGAVYDPATHRYDHHQRTFTDCLEGFNTKLSSAGLVYKHFGKEILRTVIESSEQTTGPASDEFVNACYLKVYKDFMEHVDAIDNGVSVCPSGEPKYHISTTLSNRVGQFNPAWNAPQTSEIQNEKFGQALLLTGSEFLAQVQGLIESWWPARSLVQDALTSRFEVCAEGSVLVLSQACPWKDHLFELEKEGDLVGSIIYALYADTGGSWRIQAVPINPNSFDSRKKLPAAWCGLRDAELSEKSGIEGCIFVHASGFIGGHATKEGAIAMAKLALTL